MLNWLRKRRLSPEGRKRLLIATARAEEALIRTHVANLLDVIDALGDEADLDRAVELYLERIPIEESLAAAVTTRLLARLEAPEHGNGRREGRFRNAFSVDR